MTDFICPVCGQRDYVPSMITLRANYGSIHDGDRVTIYICGSCFDKLVSIINVTALTMSENGLTSTIFEE